MNDHCIEARDPETLLGPLMWLLTRLATEGGGACAHDLAQALTAHSTALAAHPGVSLEMRLAAGSIAIEHRSRACACSCVTRG